MRKIFKMTGIFTLGLLLLIGTTVLAAPFEGPVPDSFDQAPKLEELVKSGELPPVEERLPEEPYVVDPVERVGDYGGTLNAATTRVTSWGEDSMIMDPAMLVQAKADGSGHIPALASEIESSEDKSIWTIHLREGIKWSDGELFTADDILFWYKRVLLNEDLTPVIAQHWKFNGEVVQVEKVDKYTVKFNFGGPKPFFPNRLVHSVVHYPKHYAKQFHPDFVSQEDLNEKVEEADYDNWWEFFGEKVGVWTATLLGTIPTTNTDVPTLAPYVLVSQNSSRRVYERNPYFWKVDKEGNQLPYIDVIKTEAVSDREVLNGMVMSGEVDFSGFETDIRNYPMFKKYEDKGGYDTLLWQSGMASEVIYMVNQTVEDEKLREIFQDVKFRKALSLAINREEINESIYYGRAEPTQYTVLESSKYYEPEFAKSNIKYNPEKAKNLLDEIGLKDTDGDGLREYSDGSDFTFTIEFYASETPKTPNIELVSQHWRDLGLDVNTKAVSNQLQAQRAPANMMDSTIWHGDKCSDILFPIANNLVIPRAPGWDASQWVEWGRWSSTDGESGKEPPAEVKQIREWYEQMMVEPSEEKRIELGKKILESQAENLWVIGTVGKAPFPIIKDKELHNVPENGLWFWDTLWSMSREPSQFFFEGGVNEE